MLAQSFCWLGWTRDDKKWLVAMAIAIIVGLAALTDTTVKLLGLPSALVPWLPWCRLAALIVGIVSGKMATSGLPGKTAP